MMIQKAGIACVCVCLLACSSPRKTAAVSNENEKVLSIRRGPDNPRNSEGDFIQLRDGTICYAYSHFTGISDSDFGNAYIAARTSDDGGKTWSADRVMIPQEGALSAMSVSFLRLQNGTIALFYLKVNSEHDCIPWMRISADETRTWSEPIRCIRDREGYFVVNNDRIIQLKNGRLLLPTALHTNAGDPGGAGSASIWCYYSDDNGQTWMHGPEVPNPEGVITQEPGVVELSDGTIMMFIRTASGVQYKAYSSDRGETWSAAGRSNIVSPQSPASLVRIPSTHDLLLVWNNNGATPNRTPLNMAVSKDEGRTWIHTKILEDNPAGSYCYTAIDFTGNYVLLAYFDWAERDITIRRISLDWIYK